MARAKKAQADTTTNFGFEAELWAAADALRNNMDAAEYKPGDWVRLRELRRWTVATG
jgi:hypothetical protein